METQAKKVFKKVLSDTIKNIIFYGIIVIVIAFIGNALGLRTIGLVLAGVFTIIAVLNLFPFLVSLTLTPIGSAMALKGREKEEINKQKHLAFGTLILLIENSVNMLYVLYLYNAFFN